MHPILFHIGPVRIYSLGLFWAIGALMAGWILQLELKRCGRDTKLAATIVMSAAIGGLMGARLLFVVEEWNEFLRAPLPVLLSGAGFSWFGGLLGGGLTTTWSFKKYRLPFWETADISAPALALAYGIGRIGCFLAGDATWGKVTEVPWGMAFPDALAGWADPLTGIPYAPGVKVHPTQLYELLQSLIVFAILWSIRKKPHDTGAIFYLYLILAGSMRFIVEFWRANPVFFLRMTEYQVLSLIIVVMGAGLLYRNGIESNRLTPSH